MKNAPRVVAYTVRFSEGEATIVRGAAELAALDVAAFVRSAAFLEAKRLLGLGPSLSARLRAIQDEPAKKGAR